MPTIGEAREILRSLGLPTAQQNDMAALTLLALCNLAPDDDWSHAQRHRVTITKGTMAFVAERYGKRYAPNTRETFRRQVLHQFVQGHIADYNPYEPSLPTNSPKAHYAISDAALAAIQSYDTADWDDAVRRFLAQQGGLLTIYHPERARHRVPIQLPDGQIMPFSPGKHNELQRAIIELFAPQFAPGSELLYLGDTAKKSIVMQMQRLVALGIPVSEHDKLPDVVLFDASRRWLFLVEAVTSHGPMTPKRIVELSALLGDNTVGLIFITAFPDLAAFRKYLRDIAWDTEVWIADMPDHLIHFNGDRFLGPQR